MSFGHAYNRFHLFLIVPFRNIVYQLLDDVHTFQYFFHTDHVTCKTVAFGVDNFSKIYLAIHRIGMTLADIACPTAGTSCTSCCSERDSVFP